MRSQWCTLGLLIPLLAPLFSPVTPVGATPSDPLLSLQSIAGPETGLRARDGHHHHGAPLLELNETEVTMYHAPTPPSYWTIDIEGDDPAVARYPGLMGLHTIAMSLAFFVALPAGIAMRSVKHPLHGLVVLVFYGLCTVGCAASALYKKLTPNMYEDQVHSSQGYWILALSLLLTSIDAIAFARRLLAFLRNGEQFGIKRFWGMVILGREDLSGAAGSTSEYEGLILDDPEEYDEVDLSPNKVLETSAPLHVRRNKDLEPVQTHGLDEQLDDSDGTAQWANDIHHHRSQSASSERTVFGSRSPKGSQHSDETLHEHGGVFRSLNSRYHLLRRIGRGVFATTERVLVFAGFMQLLTGTVVYTGGCRQNYINGCLAHLIKGGIFWCYGLISFARFLGSFSELGWAWNRAPTGQHPTAEFVESSVIFLYGITNTWMERFGANPGDPYTTKQVQHISIAVMFWFAGLVGMGIESRVARRWLASAATASLRTTTLSEAVTEPPSYASSFNPFPALVIGVTGAAMSAHAQTYLFQVQIHALWGYLLLGSSALRCLTYFFLWLGPPRSILPSRPPTEALGSFFLACGGLMFMFSTEEVTIAAMRKGRDDMMMFLNVAVAVTCFAFCWVFFVVAFRGWIQSRKLAQYSSA